MRLCLNRISLQAILGSAVAYRLGLFFGGGLSVLAFAPFGHWWLLLITTAFYGWRLLAAESKAEAFFAGWCFGLGFFAFGVYWVYISAGIYGTGGVVGGLLVTAAFVGFLALFPALVMLFSFWLGAHSKGRRLCALLFFWVLFEWIRGWIFTGFPWLLVGHSLIDSPLAVYAPIGGTLLLSLLLLLTSMSALGIFCLKSLWRLLMPVLVSLIWMAASLIDPLQYSSIVGEPLQVGVVQGSFSQDLKWKPEMLDETVRRYLQLSSPLWGEVDLIVWPETAIPDFLHALMEDLLLPLKQKAVATDTTLIMGIPYFDFDTYRYFNAVLSLGEKTGIYFKRHLVPFGEYLPLRWLFGSSLDFLGSPIGDFTPGDGSQVTTEVNGYPVALSVCFEIVPGNKLRMDAAQAAWLVNVSNDGWFGRSIAADQHLQIARMRALENNRMVIRSTNTGITAIVEADGTIQASIETFVPGVLSGTVAPRIGLTPYTRFGDQLVIIAVLLGLFGLLIAPRSRSGSRATRKE